MSYCQERSRETTKQINSVKRKNIGKAIFSSISQLLRVSLEFNREMHAVLLFFTDSRASYY